MPDLFGYFAAPTSGLLVAPFTVTLKVKTGLLALEQENRNMGKKLYVGNLDYSIVASDLEQMFATHGTVESAQVITDRDSGRSKGFGFVEMSSSSEADAAISALNGSEHNGRALTVNEAKPKENRSGGGGGRRGGFGGGGGGGGSRRY